MCFSVLLLSILLPGRILSSDSGSVCRAPWESKDPGGCSFGPGSISGKGLSVYIVFY